MCARCARTLMRRPCTLVGALGGLLHVDDAIRGAVSSEEYFATIRQLRLGQPAVDQAFRRMVCNLAARNQDDYVKNLAFLMRPDGVRALAPAYDVTWAVGGQWVRSHQMTVRGKDDGFSRDEMHDAFRRFRA